MDLPGEASLQPACLPSLKEAVGKTQIFEGMRTLRRDLAYAGNLLMVVKRSRLVAGA